MIEETKCLISAADPSLALCGDKVHLRGGDTHIGADGRVPHQLSRRATLSTSTGHTCDKELTPLILCPLKETNSLMTDKDILIKTTERREMTNEDVLRIEESLRVVIAHPGLPLSLVKVKRLVVYQFALSLQCLTGILKRCLVVPHLPGGASEDAVASALTHTVRITGGLVGQSRQCLRQVCDDLAVNFLLSSGREILMIDVVIGEQSNRLSLCSTLFIIRRAIDADEGQILQRTTGKCLRTDSRHLCLVSGGCFQSGENGVVGKDPTVG